MEAAKMPVIVISAINIFTGGPLSILNDCLRTLQKNYSEEYEIIALVHDRSLITTKEINCIEFPLSRKSYLFRLYYEYIYFKKLSHRLKPYLWFSLHDMTPNIVADIQAVYCHNSTPFYKSSLKDLYYEPSTYFFSLFYIFLYRINIRRNKVVIVQQNWMRDRFKTIFKLRNVLSVHPDTAVSLNINSSDSDRQRITFFYPSLPRVFKNFEVIAEAVRIIEKTSNIDFRVILTLDGSENRYARHIFRKYSHLNKIEFIGLQDRNEIFRLYSESQCLLFPSKLESWGLPLSEFKVLNKPIFVADMPYAKETLGDFKKVCYFNPDSAADLANLMHGMLKGEISFDVCEKIVSPDAYGWSELLDIVVNQNSNH